MKCTCGKKAVYYRRYEGSFYCKDCFKRQIEKEIKKTIGKYDLIEKPDHIVVGVSGGMDSGTLLYVLKKTFKNVRKIKISALIIDEGIKGYRNKAIKKAEKLCKKLDVPLTKISFSDYFQEMDDIAKNHVNTCTFCGVFRRYLLNKKAREMGATKLAVGHNLDDEAESVLMNVLRGDVQRFERLGPKPGVIRDKNFVPRIKPLIKIPKREIAVYAMLNKIPYIESDCPYSYNNVRRDAMNILNTMEEKYPSTKKQVVGFFENMESRIKKPKNKSLKKCKMCDEPTNQEICKACQFKKIL